jgi:hypothetical protein
MKSFILFNIIFFSNIAIADGIQKILKIEEFRSINFELPHAEPSYSDYLAIIDKYYGKHFTEEEQSNLSRHEKNIRLDEIYKTKDFTDILKNVYMRRIHRQNYRQQVNAIIRGFQNQTSFDIPDSAWVPTCEHLNSIKKDDKPCNKAQAKTVESSSARAAYYTNYWLQLTFSLSSLLKIYPTTSDMALEYYFEDITPGKNYNEALQIFELTVNNNAKEKEKYRIAALGYMVVEEIKKLDGTKIIEMSTQDLEALPIIDI